MFLDWQTVVSTFTLILLAELGDKTQLSAFAFASRSKSPFSVFLGSSAALVFTSFLAVAMGGILGQIIPGKLIKVLAGLVFVAFGVLSLAEAFKG